MTHVLVARLDNDGDVLLAGPAIRAAKRDAERLTLLCGPRGLQAAALLPAVDDILVHRAEWIDPEPAPFENGPTQRLLLELARRAVDEAVVLTSFHQSPLPLALLLRLAGIPRIGATSEDYPGSLLDVRHRIDDDVHEVERSLSLMRAMGHELPETDDGALRVRELDDTAAAAARPFDAETPYVVVHPGASVPARAWAPARHVELVGALVDAGWHVAVTGSPSERALTAEVAAGASPHPHTQVRDLGGTTDLAQLAAVLAGAAVVVVGNTGPAHLAAAVGTPVVSLYAPTVPAVRWRPWRVPHAILNGAVPCAGCRARSCPVPGHPCIDRLPLARVLEAVQRLATPVPAEQAEEAAAA
ncbi:MAG TPA: glycosyltransferase family 9 protein [Conexibacter sp.]|nr:glycosyltransferase family 9 protein [Conexibacter sp.]